MISKDITAESMAKLATQDNEELAYTLDNIYVNAINGERELIMLGRTLNEDTANELRRRGFKVEFFGDDEFINTSITW